MTDLSTSDRGPETDERDEPDLAPAGAGPSDRAEQPEPADEAGPAGEGEEPVVADPGDPGGPGDEDDDEGGDGPGGLSWARVVVLGAALAFLGFAVGVFVSQDTPPGEGSVDVGFYQDMITHHQQALGMATLELANGEDATVRSFAREVLTFQSMEVGTMRQTLTDWDLSPDERPAEAMGWMGMGMAVPADQMPGLITDDQLDQMTDARGAEADALFLQLMADHHRGGLHMAEYATDQAGDEGVRELAARMARNQAQEINEYRILAEREGIDVTIEPVEVPPAAPAG